MEELHIRIRKYLLQQNMYNILLNLAVQELTELLSKALPGDQLEVQFTLILPGPEARAFMEAVRGKETEHHSDDLPRN